MTALIYLGVFLAIAYGVYVFAPKGWRTIRFNEISAIPVVLQLLAELVRAFDGIDLTVYFPGVQWALVATLIVQVVNRYLREITTTPPRSGG